MDKFFSNFKLIFAMEFRETLRSRFFRTLSVIFGIIILLAAAAVLLLHLLPSGFISQSVESGTQYAEELVGITPDQTDALTEYAVVIDDRTGGVILSRLTELTPFIEYHPAGLDAESICGFFNSGSIDGCLVVRSVDDIVFYLHPYEYHHRLITGISAAAARIAQEQAIVSLGISPSDAIAAIGTPSPLITSEVSRTDLLTPPPEDDGFSFSFASTGASISVFLISTLLFTSVSFYGQMVSNRVSAEKSTRMIEILANCASPAELLCGKVLGVGTAGFAQVTVFYSALIIIASAGVSRLTAALPYFGDILSEIIGSAAGNAGYIFMYLLLGFFQLAFTYGCIGAISTDTEGVSGFAALPLYLPSAGYIIAMLAPSIGGSALLTAASYLPLLAPFAMPARLGVEAVVPWEIILSLVIQLAATALIAIIAAKLYRRYMLRYGQPPRLQELINSLRK